MSRSIQHENAGANLHISMSGETGPIVILLHFWGGSSSTYRYVTKALNEHCFTLAMDFRGWGSSTTPSNPDTPLSAYSITQLADDVESFIRAKKFCECILVGHSMGAKVAQLVAARGRTEGKVKGVVLLAPAPPTPLVLEGEAKEQQLVAYNSTQAAEFVMRNVLTSSRITDEDVKSLVEDALKGSAVAKKAWPLLGMGEDISQETVKNTLPALVISGDLDKVEPTERVRSEVLSQLGPQAPEIIILEGVGHMLPIEAPKLVADHIWDFVQKTVTPENYE